MAQVPAVAFQHLFTICNANSKSFCRFSSAGFNVTGGAGDSTLDICFEYFSSLGSFLLYVSTASIFYGRTLSEERVAVYNYPNFQLTRFSYHIRSF
jgi:hypothetical protein